MKRVFGKRHVCRSVLTLMIVVGAHASAQTAVVGWSESKRTSLEQIARDLTDQFGATPDTLVLTPGHVHIVFDNPPFAPIWATPGPRGGQVCHDLGFMLRDVAKPIARYVYIRSSDPAIDTFSVVFHLAARYGAIGRCSSTARLGFSAAELRTLSVLLPVRDPNTPGFV